MIKINDEIITEQEFDLALADSKQRYGIPTLQKEHVDVIASQLIDARLFLIEAKKENINITDEEVESIFEKYKQTYKDPAEFDKVLEANGDNHDSFAAKIRENILLDKYINQYYYDKTSVTDEQAENYFQQYQDKFTSKEQVKASHILFKEDDLEKAKKVKEELDNGADFIEKVMAHSECPSKSNQGDLGYFGKGQMVAEFEKAAFESEVNQLIGPIKTQFGYHLIKVEDKTEARKLKFEEVKEDLKKQMKESLANENIKNEALKLRKENNIEINQELLQTKVEQ